jgi:hypothetical protein
VCVDDVVAVLGCEEVAIGVHILRPRTKKLQVTTNVSQKHPSAIFDDPNTDWLSVQKDIVTQNLWKTDFNDTDFAGWTYSGKAVSPYMGVPTYMRYRMFRSMADIANPLGSIMETLRFLF